MSGALARVAPYLWYPTLFAVAIAGFALLLERGAPLAAATYAPVFAVAVAILLLELRFPERADWRPTRADVAADAAFMAVVQIAVPRLLMLLAVFALADRAHAQWAASWWPHAWPLWAQVVTMLLAVDFLRYWLHRACHAWMPLWRLHEVHHSPDILYTLNVGRFHPFEKALHFACDSVPFLLIGVAPEVIAGYFLMYAVNGFFQHSNLRLRYGWLNYVVGSAETHRWHHARDPKDAACNFGNTTIVWDLVFGTFRAPTPVGEIGIVDRAYPKGFWAQLGAPFAQRGDRSLARRLADAVIPRTLALASRLHAWKVGRLARDPMRVQRKLLVRILRENAQTSFGRRHGFAAVTSVADYAAAVPVMEFEALRPYIDAEIERAEASLTREAPLQYMRTSGSTGRPKDIPLIATHLEALRAIQRRSVAFQYRTCPDAFEGSILAMVSPAEEGRLANGKAYGAASGIVAAGTPRIVQEKFVLPAAVQTIEDARLKYLVILRLALQARDLTYFGSANSTTPLALMKLCNEHGRELAADLRRGSFRHLDALAAPVRAAVAARLRPMPARAAELESLLARGEARMADLWPELRLVVTWTCGSAGVTVRALRAQLDRHTRVLELGYVSSEFRGTVTIGRRAGSGFPCLEAHFYEFADRERWDAGDRTCVTLDALRKGVDYYIMVTTPSGLYRYFINDVVRVTGFLHRTPLLKFMQKGKGVTNITGEKLYESQVLAAVGAAMESLERTPRFVMMLADEEARAYRLYVEPDAAPGAGAAQLAREVDTRLRALNVEYDAKRASERLSRPVATWLRAGTGETYKRHCVGQGQREGQFKTVALAYRRTFGFDLDAHADAGGGA
jgi:sterol desaturase/sphingolipid hydroxylase (fatty acid hydroxylase superfamily)